ncbi:hypothetical protein EI94DRAFT_1816851 [Lactarius quietus]|nr:hypothetical protein EI94DRAFT_1816851 [Lactarius quietus]
MPIAVPSIDQSPHLHRRDLKEAIKSMHPPASSLDWSLGFLSRSSNRSDNQTPHGGAGKNVRERLRKFLRSTEELADEEA